jgi:YgiT-type zinc finger domain-containing protein
MRCNTCGAQLAAMRTDLPFKVRGAGIVILKGLPIFECRSCPGYVIEDAAMARVDEVLGRVDGTTEVAIIRYAGIEHGRAKRRPQTE